VRYDQLWRLATAALKKGAVRVSGTRIEWRIAGNCEAPVQVSYHARPPAKKDRGYVIVGPGRKRPISFTLWVKCRCCRSCKRHKVDDWSSRVLREYTSALQRGCRTWLATLTCSPVYLLLKQLHCINKEALKGKDFQSLPLARQRRDVDAECYRDIVKFLKRVRRGRSNQEPAEISYVCVTEFNSRGARQDEPMGNPHWHILIHEIYAEKPVRQRAFRSAVWIGGYTDFSLCEENPAYICKYLSKEGGRVRASKYYGTMLRWTVGSENSIEDVATSETDKAVVQERSET
jgi:hypothetical protein